MPIVSAFGETEQEANGRLETDYPGVQPIETVYRPPKSASNPLGKPFAYWQADGWLGVPEKKPAAIQALRAILYTDPPGENEISLAAKSLFELFGT